MEIPNKVKIGGIEYIVNKNTRPCKNDMNVDGEIIYDMGTIELREGSGECKDYQDMVFVHEVMHGIFHHMCIEQDEELIKKISMGLHQVIKDNPHIFIEKCVGSSESLGELCAEEKGIKMPKHQKCNHLLKRGQFSVEKMYMDKCSFLTVGAEEYIQGMEEGFARLDAYRYPYIKDPSTGEVFLIKPTEINMIVTSLTDNNQDGNIFVLTKDEFDKKYDPIS